VAHPYAKEVGMLLEGRLALLTGCSSWHRPCHGTRVGRGGRGRRGGGPFVRGRRDRRRDRGARAARASGRLRRRERVPARAVCAHPHERNPDSCRWWRPVPVEGPAELARVMALDNRASWSHR